MLSGKKPEITEDMNLQQVFKTFYSRAKTVSVSGESAKNSAMSSLTGFSQKLEQRRQAAREKKHQAEEGKTDQPKQAEGEEMKADHMKEEAKETKGEEAA